MPTYTKDNFPEIRSKPDWLTTWLIRLIFGFCFLYLIILFFALPILLYWEEHIEPKNAVVFMIFYYPLILWGCFALIKHIKKGKSQYIQNIYVDKKGLHYHKINGETESILYAKLEKSPEKHSSDLDTLTFRRYGPTLLSVYLKKKRKLIYFNKTDIGFTYYTGNYRALRAHFIQGTKLFRPDLQISPFVYSSFHIHPETFEFDKKGFIKTVIFVVIVIAIILAGMEIWMQYRFGTSLFFGTK